MPKSFAKISNNPKALELLSLYIEQNLTDKIIQEKLLKELNYEWSLETIRRQRKILEKNKQAIILDEKISLSTPPPGMPETEKAQWFKDQFIKSHLHPTLKTQFTQEEIETYLEEYGSLCCQFEDIVFSEFFQIDDFLKHRILINRQLTIIKTLEQEVSIISAYMIQHPHRDDDTKEQKTNRIEQHRLLETKRSDLHRANERYDKLIAERQKIYTSLSATRKDRIEELRGGKDSFFNLIALLQSSEQERNKQGKYAALTKIASDDMKKHFREPVEFPDGQLDPVIIDDQTYEENEGEDIG
jgi:hypothetical protein